MKEKWNDQFCQSMSKKLDEKEFLVYLDLLVQEGMAKFAKNRQQIFITQKFRVLASQILDEMKTDTEDMVKRKVDILAVWAMKISLRILSHKKPPIHYDDVNPKEAGKLASTIVGCLRMILNKDEINQMFERIEE